MKSVFGDHDLIYLMIYIRSLSPQLSSPPLFVKTSSQLKKYQPLLQLSVLIFFGITHVHFMLMSIHSIVTTSIKNTDPVTNMV